MKKHEEFRVKLRIFKLHDVRIVNQIDLPSQTLDMDDMVSKHNYLKDFPVVSYKNEQPKILLSLSDYHLSLTNKQSFFYEKGPILTETELGWMVYGPVNDKSFSPNGSICTAYGSTEKFENLNCELHGFKSIDEFDIECKAKFKQKSFEEQSLEDFFGK